MGGKQKQAQRTKGNVKPSSSARAAELLASSTQSGSGFVGFGTMSGDPGYIPATAGADDTDNNMDPDFRMVLRKLSKRDATTKLKALQEFSTLCQEKDADNIKTILVFWPRIYNRASIDHDRRVREATQQAFEQLVLRVRRNLAPHLKGLMGPWLVAQSDTYAPAATFARSSFHAAFPPAKQTEALVFCKDEILEHIHENLFVHTIHTLSDAKTTEPEDMESKFHRVVCASLNALKTFLAVIPTQDQLSLLDKYRDMLSDGKFWKYAKHSQSMIQASFYSVVSGLCQNQPDLAREFSTKISPIVLHHLDNMDPLVCSTLWEAVLYVISILHDCWQHVNVRKGMLPGLWKLLRQGGAGSATVIHPNILPFLSHISTDVTGEGTHFFTELFTNMKTGLSEERVLASPSECNAVVRAMMECLQYVISQSITDRDLMEVLIQEQLIPLLGASLLDDSSAVSASPLYPLTVDLLTYLHKISSNQEPEKSAAASAILSDIIQSFQELGVFESDNNQAIERYAAFLCAFKRQSTEPQSKGARVKFADETSPQSLDVSTKFESELVGSDGPVLGIVCQACRDAYDRSRSTKTTTPLIFFCDVIKAYSSRHVIESVWTDSRDDILLNTISPWLSDYQDMLHNPHVSQSFVDIILVLFDLCADNTKKNFLSQALKCISNIGVFQAFMKTVHQRSTDRSVHVWFKGEEFGNKMVSVTRILCQQSLGNDGNTPEAQWEMLNLAFSSNDKLEPIIGEQYLSEILQEILAALPSADRMTTLSQDQVERCVSFVCDVTSNFFSNIKGCLLLPPAEELLFSIFQFSCLQHNFIKSDAMAEKMTSTWQQGTRVLLAQRGGLLSDGGFFSKVTTHLKSSIHNDGASFDRLQNLVSVALSLARTIGNYLSDDSEGGTLSHPSVVALLREMYLPLDPNPPSQWQICVVVGHQLTVDSIPDDLLDTGPPASIPRCISHTAYTGQLLMSMVMDSVPVVTDSDPTEKTIHLDTVDGDLVLDISYAAVLSNTLLSRRQESLLRTDLYRVSQLLEDSLSHIVKHLSTLSLKYILQKALDRSLSEGGLWALCLRRILQLLPKKPHRYDFLEMVGGLDRFSSLTESSLHTLQVMIEYMSQASTEQLLDLQSAYVLTCTPDTLTKLSGCRGYLSILNRIMECASPGSLPSQVLISVLDHIKEIRQDHENIFLFDSRISEERWADVSFNIEVMCYMRLLVHHSPTQLTDSAWDFILCSLVSWVQSCNESSQDMTSEPKTQAFGVTVFDLLRVVSVCLSRIQPQEPDTFPSNLATEWSEFFSDGIYGLMLPMFLQTAGGVIGDRGTANGCCLMLSSLASTISLCPHNHIVKHQLPPKLIAGDDSSLPDDHQTVLNHLAPMLLNANRAIQIAAYRLLLSLMPDLSQFDEKLERADVEDKPARSPPGAVMSVLLSSGDALNQLLQDVTVGEPITMETHGDEYTVTMAYLLSWKLVLAFFRAAKIELRAEYSQYMRDHSLVDRLLELLYKMMPENPALQQQDILTSDTPKQKLSSYTNMFAEDPQLNIMDVQEKMEISHTACSVYSRALQDLPAILRHWYNSLEKRMSAIANRYTSKYVSPILVNQEIAAIQQTDVKLDNMTIKTRPAAREVAATYTVEEVSMELVVTLPSNHPLGQITVDCGKRIGVAATQWRNWMLQLTTFLHRQNGSILDGLTLWRRNVDKRFEGVEECMICFSVIHGSNCQLPKLQCKTCKKRFHSACLYKWFNTSNNSSCPMCRNLF